MNFGEYLKLAIQSANLTNKDFAEKYGSSPAYISNLITGKRSPSQDSFGKIIKILEPVITEEVYFKLTELFAKEKLGIDFNLAIPQKRNLEEKNINSSDLDDFKKFALLTEHQKFIIRTLIDELLKK